MAAEHLDNVERPSWRKARSLEVGDKIRWCGSSFTVSSMTYFDAVALEIGLGPEARIVVHPEERIEVRSSREEQQQ